MEFQQGGSLQIYELRERAGGTSATLCVSSVAEQIANLLKLGLLLCCATVAPGSQRTCCSIAGDEMILMIKDPDGNNIAFVERGAAL
jgi:hypothetical protein